MTRARIKITVIIFGVCLQASAAVADVLFPGVTGRPLIDSLRTHYKSARILAYAGSPDPRDTLFGEIYLTAADSLECVYSGYTIYMQPGQDPDDWALANDINCEHTWPQSLLNTAQTPNPTGDMHHLFPSRQLVNADRGNSPFAEIADANTQYWYYRDIERGTSIPSSNIDGYAEVNLNVGEPGCEPREVQQGNSARAMFYMLTMYQLADTASGWWTGQRHDLRNWHIGDPADALEKSRTWLVAAHQQNKPNPFVIDSSLVDRCYFPESLSVNTTVWFAPTSLSRSEGAGSCSLDVLLANPSPGQATTVQVVLAGGTGTAEDVDNYTTQTLTFPAGSSDQQSAILAITDDALVEGAETLVFKLRNAAGGDDAAVGGDSACTLTIEDNDRTLVSFSPASASKTEGDAPFNITVAIANPSTSLSTTADVVLSGGTGSAADINNYATQTVNFPAGSSTPQSVQITITDDALSEGTETLVFKLRNVSGGSSAAAGADSAFTLTLGDNDATVPGPFLESMGTVSTTTAIATHESNSGFDNDGLTMSGTADVRITLPSTGYAGASGGANIFITNSVGRYFLIEGINTTAKADYTLSFGIHKSTTASNGSDMVVEVSSDGSNYSPLTVPALPTGTGTAIWHYRTASGTIPTAANLRIQFRQTATATQYRIDDLTFDRTLAAELSSFYALAEDGGVTLSWRTESESGSYQWLVERADAEPGPFAELGRLPAAGTSSSPREYSWNDREAAVPGAVYWYRIGEQSLSGQTTYYGPVSCLVSTSPSMSDLVDNCVPNPFRTATEIRYQVARTSPVSLSIYNVSGQLVRKLDQGMVSPGCRRVVWDGTDRMGRRLSAGIYLYRISIGGRFFGGKVLLVK